MEIVFNKLIQFVQMDHGMETHVFLLLKVNALMVIVSMAVFASQPQELNALQDQQCNLEHVSKLKLPLVPTKQDLMAQFVLELFKDNAHLHILGMA